MTTPERAKMQTILGAGGPIADELVKEIYEKYTHDIRLVSRNPKKVNHSDQAVSADLTDAESTSRTVAGSEIAYLTVGLPMDSGLWEQKFPTIMRNVIDACIQHGVKLVFFDNTYMYPGTPAVQTENTTFAPNGRKGRVRAEIAKMLLDEMNAGRIEALICRAPEFYGPGKTKSITNQMIFDRIKAGKRALVPLSANSKRSLIWTPDASRAMALLGNTPDAFGQTWHLPIDTNRKTYKELIEIAADLVGRKVNYTVVPFPAYIVGGWFNAAAKEVQELLPRYRGDNLFDTSKFEKRFPNFRPTTYREGVAECLSQ